MRERKKSAGPRQRLPLSEEKRKAIKYSGREQNEEEGTRYEVRGTKRTEDGGRGTADRGPRRNVGTGRDLSERGTRDEVRGTKRTEDGGRRTADRGPRRSVGTGRDLSERGTRDEVRGTKRTEDGGRKTEGRSDEKPFRKPNSRREEGDNNEKPFRKSFGRREEGDNNEKPFRKPFEKKGFRSDNDRPSRKPYGRTEDGGRRTADRGTKYEVRGTRGGTKRNVGTGRDLSEGKADRGPRRNVGTGRDLSERKADRGPRRNVGTGRDLSEGKADRGPRRNVGTGRDLSGGRGQSKSREQSGELIRLNKYIANAGICSRREADVLIQSGIIKVNGKPVTELGFKVSRTDKVQYGDQTLNSETLRYVLLNKPKGFITTMDDPEDRKTVMALVEKACRERIYPVGRLDRNTTGLLLFTNDGEMAKKLTHPRYGIRKVYHVVLDKPITKGDMKKVADGIEIDEGPVQVDAIEYIQDTKDKKEVGLELHSGQNRVVRRIFESMGYKVEKLDRVAYAGLTKKNLPRGEWRFLTEMEINMLKMVH